MSEPGRARVPVVAVLVASVGVACLVAAAASWAFTGGVPAVLRHLNVAAAVVELAAAAGLARRRRAAWAFAISLEGTLALVNLLGLPYFLHAGLPGRVSAGLAAARVLLLAVLLRSEKVVSSTGS